MAMTLPKSLSSSIFSWIFAGSGNGHFIPQPALEGRDQAERNLNAVGFSEEINQEMDRLEE